MLGQEAETLVEGLFEEGEYTFRLETVNIPDGLYLLYIRVGKHTKVKKIVIQYPFCKVHL